MLRNIHVGRTRTAVSRIAVLAMGTLALAACKTTPDELPPEPVAPPTQGSGGMNTGAGAAVVPGSQADFIASVASDRVFFDTDEYNVDTTDQGILRSQAQWLMQYPNKQVTIEGHADERGTREYNLALGERRANATRNFLVSLGIPATRINTVSYGKERPVAMGSDPQAWAQNRRAVTVTVQ
ncbi:peptidoglycan-associated lipoprotein Pal [Croceicoccus sp. F390]|uniref:Peptidoglycan-associated lipoprotein n=1 Tax=Croceicoccus esteveae TaxID=3075597 RepID=A0ABU2ZEA2_9SPHN|nr:peptidoglycan-associated lipoprotein Pal [Croceicoccus sp. F390]MDT0574927.1 peptidoglycan-associated lipoprotein Pal [Croceicoccus sp. F390]